MSTCDLGLIGLAVMGQNLVLNMERNGYRVAVFNRSPDRTRQFMAGAAAGKKVFPYEDIPSFIGSLISPRRVMLMVKAGEPVDQVIHEIKPYLQAGDLIIDGGNSFYRDTERRAKELESDGLYYLGVGISGGEEGALHGPSIMPSGSPQAYALMGPVFEAISAKVDGEPCVTYLGPGGAGHFVKMVHNGIEYGDMQLIAEAYDILRRGLNLSAQELKNTFTDWNRGPLSSYLIEITADIFGVIDPQSKQPLVEVILDEAEQKGTGKWTGQEALELGVPIPTLNAAVEARFLSALRQERLAAAPLFSAPPAFPQPEKSYWITAIEGALYASKICSYAQGMAMLSAASREYGYNFNLSEIARIWRGGCIIRARFLDDVRQAFRQQPDLPNLMLAEFFRNALARVQPAWREVVSFAVEGGIPLPAMSASLAYFDSYRSGRLPANLIQAQRDYFGAHTYRRLDQPGVFHTDWQK